MRLSQILFVFQGLGGIALALPLQPADGLVERKSESLRSPVFSGVVLAREEALTRPGSPDNLERRREGVVFRSHSPGMLEKRELLTRPGSQITSKDENDLPRQIISKDESDRPRQITWNAESDDKSHIRRLL